jgi:hypothetical protein
LDLAKSWAEIKNPLFMPFPDRSVGYLKPPIDEPSDRARKIRLFFSGSYRGYRGGVVQSCLGKLERESIVEAFRGFPGTFVISEREQLDAILAGSSRTSNIGFYCVETAQYRIPIQDWYRVLANVDVFLSPPGVCHPWSHNVAEAMAVGAIPLTNYPEWFHPRLQDGLTCFEFHDNESLHSQFNHIANVSNERLLAMRRNVQQYYLRHLDPQAFCRRLKSVVSSGAANETTIVMQTEINDFFSRLRPDSIANSHETAEG